MNHLIHLGDLGDLGHMDEMDEMDEMVSGGSGLAGLNVDKMFLEKLSGLSQNLLIPGAAASLQCWSAGACLCWSARQECYKGCRVGGVHLRGGPCRMVKNRG